MSIGMKGCEYGPDETLRMLGVLHLYDCPLLFQPLWRVHVTRAMKGTVLCYGKDEFRNSVQDEPPAAGIPVLHLLGEVSGDCLHVQILHASTPAWRNRPARSAVLLRRFEQRLRQRGP